MSPASIIHMTAVEGHRLSYIELFGPMLALTPSTGRIGGRLAMQLVRAQRLFFGTLDDDVYGFTFVCLLRSLLGRKTCGLFLRPNSCFFAGWKAVVKRCLFATLKRMPGVTILSIIPFEISPELRGVATASVHDPQFWDKLDDGEDRDVDAMTIIRKAAGDKPILAFIGGLTTAKDFPRLVRLFEQAPDVLSHIHLIVAGPHENKLSDDGARLRSLGATVWDRYISDAELAAIYYQADWIWTAYSRGYEQASGIFGRSVQYGRPVLIRQSSHVLDRYVEMLGHVAIKLSEDDEAARTQLRKLGSRTQCDHSKNVCAQWKQDFVKLVGAGL